MKNIVRILLLSLVLSSASQAAFLQHNQERPFERVMSVLLNPEQGFSIRVWMKLLSDTQRNDNDFENFSTNGRRWMDEYSGTGASLFKPDQQLNSLDKFWAWVLVMTIEKRLSLENFSALLDYSYFGQIPDQVISRAFQLFCGTSPVFELLAQRGTIDEEDFETNEYLLPLRCERTSFRDSLKNAKPRPNPVFSKDVSDYQLRKLLEKNSNLAENLVKSEDGSSSEGLPLIFWVLEKYFKGQYTLSSFELLFDDYRGEMYLDKTLWETVFLSNDKELISFVVQSSKHAEFRYLIMCNKQLAPSIAKIPHHLQYPSEWERFFQENRCSLDQELDHARQNLVLNVISLIKQGNQSFRELVSTTPLDIGNTAPAARHKNLLVFALEYDLEVFKDIVNNLGIKITNGLLLQELVKIAEKRDFSLADIVNNAAAQAFREVHDEEVKGLIRKRYPDKVM